MVLGIYYLTTQQDGAPGEGRAFSSLAEAVMAYDAGELDLQAKITICGCATCRRGACWSRTPGDMAGFRLETTLGRTLFNEALPSRLPVRRQVEVSKRELGAIVNDLAERYPKVQVAATLDALKETGFPLGHPLRA